MQRILQPGQIEALASRSVPRLALPRRDQVFVHRAMRLRELAPNHSLGGYLRLVAAIADSQHRALLRLVLPPPDPAARAQARDHAMPLAPARGLARGEDWRLVLAEIIAAISAQPGFPAEVAGVCARLGAASPGELEARADRLFAADGHDPDPAAALFVVAALQVYWTALAAGLAPDEVSVPEQCGVCPVCGTLPVASVVRAGAPYTGYRYLHCGLCATEWHRVRVECTQCGATKNIAYQSIEGGSAAIRAETCDSCQSYRTIYYQEHDAAVEPLVDDLASVALDLLLAEAGFHRASPNPLFWLPGD